MCSSCFETSEVDASNNYGVSLRLNYKSCSKYGFWVKVAMIPESLHPVVIAASTRLHCGEVRAAGHDRSQISWQSNSGICQLVQQQINDNYPADMSTVITLQDQEQGKRETKKGGMKGCGPHLALS